MTVRSLNRILLPWLTLGLLLAPFFPSQDQALLGSSALWLIGMPFACLLWINGAAMMRLVMLLIRLTMPEPPRGARYLRQSDR